MAMPRVAEPCLLSATEMRRELGARRIGAVELLEAHLETIERVNPQLNAIVTLDREGAMEAARAADRRLGSREPLPLLHGLPIAHKDFLPTAGVRTTFGSPIFAHHIPDHDALVVHRLKSAGAVSLGKTNTPEWAAGSNCTNPVFGATRNPYNLSCTSGGSSGGSAAALACGLVALADGTDMGGSLRNPASFCNVVGLRSSPGRVPAHPSALPWHPFTVHGVMARTVEDLALAMRAVAGPDDRSPIALPESGDLFAGPLARDFTGVHVAWSRRLGDLPVDPAVTAVLERQRPVLEELGCVVEDREPDFAGADVCFETWRAWIFEALLGEQLDARPEMLGRSVRWNTEEGRHLTGPQLAAAERLHGELYERLRRFLVRDEFLAAPVVQVLPFAAECEYPREIEGVPMKSYIDWMKSCWYISTVGLPAISVPAGFTEEGLPIGLQIVGRHRDDVGVLQLAHAFEQRTKHWRHRPPLLDG
jgi:amidase